MSETKITRDEFLNSRYLIVRLVDLQKNLLHHNKFVFEITTDQCFQKSRKNYNEIKRFSEELSIKYGMQEFILEKHMRSSQRYRSIQNLFKKLNNGYLVVSEAATESQLQKKVQIRNYLYNLFFCNIDQQNSEDEEKDMTNLTNVEVKSKKEQVLSGEEKKEKNDENYLAKFKGLYKSKSKEYEERKSSMLKNIPLIWVKQRNLWIQKFYTFQDNIIIFTDKHNNKQVIVLKKMEFVLQQQNYHRIQIKNPLLLRPIELRLQDMGGEKDTDLGQYLKLLSVLKEISLMSSNFEEDIYNFVKISILNKKNRFSLESQRKIAKQLSLKVTHEYLSFSVMVDSLVQIIIPITNNYGKIEFQVIEQRQAGLIPNIRQYKIFQSIPIQNIYDYLYNPVPKRKNADIKVFILQSKYCNYSLKFDYQQYAHEKSYFSVSSEDIYEGEKAPSEFKRNQFRIQKNRLKRIVYFIEQNVNYIKSLIRMQYPFRSYLFYLVLFLSIIFFNADWIVHYLLIGIISVILYFHPLFSNYVRETIQLCKIQDKISFLQEKLREKGYAAKFKVRFKKDIEKKNFLQNFKFTSKKQRNIIQKYQRLQYILLKIQLLMTQFVSIVQKLKNTCLWYHHNKTKKLLICLLIGLLVITFIPIKMILLAALWKVFTKGKTYRIRTKQINRIILFQMTKACIEEHNLKDFNAYFLDQNKPFTKKSNEYLAFQKRFTQWLSEKLQIYFDAEIFNQSKNVFELINYLSDCPKRFIIPAAICKKYKFNMQWSANINTLTKVMFLIYGFIVNVPSDKNILGIQSSNQKDDNDDSDENQEI